MSVFAAALLAGGCATDFSGSVMPDYPADKVVDHLQCELRRAYRANLTAYPWLEQWAVSFTLTLKREDSGTLGPTFNSSPLITGGVLNLNTNAGVTATGTRTLTTKRTLRLANLNGYECAGGPSAGTIFAGDLGLAASLSDALGVHGAGDPTAPEPDDLGYRLDFVIKLSAGATPGFVFERVTNLGAGASAYRQNFYTLDLAFTDARPRAPMRVQVTNWPSVVRVSPIPSRPSAETHPPGRRMNVSRRGGRQTSQPQSTPLPPDVRQRLDSTLQRLQLENLRIQVR